MIDFTLDPRWKAAVEDIDISDDLNDHAKRASAYAESTSPVLTGSYKNGHGWTRAERTSDGWEAGIHNTDRDANLIEFGWGPTPSYRTLTRAVESTGLRFTAQ